MPLSRRAAILLAASHACRAAARFCSAIAASVSALTSPSIRPRSAHQRSLVALADRVLYGTLYFAAAARVERPETTAARMAVQSLLSRAGTRGPDFRRLAALAGLPGDFSRPTPRRPLPRRLRAAETSGACSPG